MYALTPSFKNVTDRHFFSLVSRFSARRIKAHFSYFLKVLEQGLNIFWYIIKYHFDTVFRLLL